MSQHDQHWDGTQTLRGFGRFAESATFSGRDRPGFIQVGARVGQAGQLFETNGGSGSGPMVIKLLAWGVGLDERVVHDFTREAMTVANLRHPHVVHVADAGTLPDGTPFVVMERLRGETLEKAAQRGSMQTLELLAILRGLASALSAAHAAGVVHGELRADNVFMAEVAGYGRGFPKLLDFGVAQLTAAARARGQVADRPAADERSDERSEERSDERSDQLALAALTYRLLTGAGHFAGETRGHAFERADTEVGRPRLVPSDAASSAHRVLSRAMSGNREQRFDSVASFFHAFEEALLAAGPTPERSAVVAPPSPPQTAPERASLTQQFFAEGERQEIAHAEGAGRDVQEEDDSGAEEIAAISGTFDRVPRNRTRMIGAASLALASAVLMGWTALALSRAHGSAGPLATEPPRQVVAPQLEASPPALARMRGALRHTRAATVSGNPRPSRTKPLPVGRTPGPARADSTAPAASEATATSAPAAAPPPASATPAPPTDDDFTQPWEQTEGEPSEAPPAAAALPVPEAPPTPAALPAPEPLPTPAAP